MKKVTLCNLSIDSARKKRSLAAVKKAVTKNRKVDYNKERAEKLKQWREWWI